MKKIKTLSLLVFAVFVAAAFGACKGGDRDDGDDNNEEGVLFTNNDGSQYKMSLSELKDSNSELTFNQKYEYIKPFELKESIAFTFKYSADETPASDSAKKSLPITEANMVIDCGSESDAEKVRDRSLTDAMYDITVEGSKIICNYKEATLERMTFGTVELLYNEFAKQIGDQRKKNESAKPNTNNNEGNSTNVKINYNFDKDSVGEIVSTDSTIGYTLVKSGVVAVYTFNYDKNGYITGGKAVCECKNRDVAREYAKDHAGYKYLNGDRIYSSVNVDGNKVILVYSAIALDGLTKDSIIRSQRGEREPEWAPDKDFVFDCQVIPNEEDNEQTEVPDGGE